MVSQSQHCPRCFGSWDETYALVACDACGVMSHADCEGLSQEDLAAIEAGTHADFGLQFLCVAGCAQRNAMKLVGEFKKLDSMNLFALPVDETTNPRYREVVHRPMDLSTMEAKAERGEYRSTQLLRFDCELMVHNALRFNRDGGRRRG